MSALFISGAKRMVRDGEYNVRIWKVLVAALAVLVVLMVIIASCAAR